MRGIRGVIRTCQIPVGDAKVDKCHHVDRGGASMNHSERVLAAGRSLQNEP